jgi:hypothetical protein
MEFQPPKKVKIGGIKMQFYRSFLGLMTPTHKAHKCSRTKTGAQPLMTPHFLGGSNRPGSHVFIGYYRHCVL